MKRKASWQRHWVFKRSRGLPRFVGDGRRVGFMHALKGGAPVLKTEASWRTINGVFINTRWGYISFCFRRVAK